VITVRGVEESPLPTATKRWTTCDNLISVGNDKLTAKAALTPWTAALAPTP
jgi:hypothetical protein